MDFIFGDISKKEIKGYEKIIDEIVKYRRTLVSLSNEELKEKTKEFKDRLSNGETLDDILPEAFAVAREASRRYLGKEQRPVQLMGAMALHNGDVAEMKTGEGKTLTAPIAAYLNALTGNGVHIATANDYLASRDAEDLRPMFEGLGLTVGVVLQKRLSDKIQDSEEFKSKVKEDLELRKKAYSCDITYGSSNAFAFDYLRDNTAKDIDSVVRREDEVGFIIIDEADQILVNDAVMPFKLSGKINSKTESTDIDLSYENIRKAREKELAQINLMAGTIIDRLFNEKLRTKQFTNINSMRLREGVDKDKTEQAQTEYNVLYCKGVDAELTERGWLEVFRYFEANNFINKHPELITDNKDMILDQDYYMDCGQVFITINGLGKAVNVIPQMKELNNEFYSSNRFADIRTAISNSLKAYFVLENGKEYILTDVSSSKGKMLKKVLLVSNGRAQEGRSYSGGLQQAIELKESMLNSDITIESTKEHEELASISQKAFYSIYPKIAGMTGTSAKELFENVYGMNTINIPKHTEYKASHDDVRKIYSCRIDKDTVLFATDEEKMEAVIKSCIESYKKGQPVLIGTLSITDSNKLYEEFTKRGIPCEKLNAENAELEGKIISGAGKKSAITISTQMAGRGTDIKLGGELEDAITKRKNEVVEQLANNINPNIPLEERRKIALHHVESKAMDTIVLQATSRLEKEKEELIELGGLKVIGYGHYPTKRDDDQLRGRAARQADPGVTEFYTSVSDLKKNLLVSGYKIQSLRKKGLSPNNPLTGEEVDKVINEAQANREGLLTSLIVSTQEVEHNLSQMRQSVYSQRMRMLQGEDVKENMEFMIERSVVDLIDRNLPDYTSVTHKTKITKSGLNINNFLIDVEEVFGFDLEEELSSNRFKTLGDLESYLLEKSKEQYNLTRSKNKDQDELDRARIIDTLDEAWRSFNENLEEIKIQGKLHSLAQNKDYDEIFVMKKGFNKTLKDSRLEMLGKMFGKPSTKTRVVEQEKDIVEEIDDVNDYFKEDKKSYSKLSVRPFKIISALSEKISLVKGKTPGKQINSNNEIDDDKIQNIDFEDSSITYTSSKK